MRGKRIRRSSALKGTQVDDPPQPRQWSTASSASSDAGRVLMKLLSLVYLKFYFSVVFLQFLLGIPRPRGQRTQPSGMSVLRIQVSVDLGFNHLKQLTPVLCAFYNLPCEAKHLCGMVIRFYVIKPRDTIPWHDRWLRPSCLVVFTKTWEP